MRRGPPPDDGTFVDLQRGADGVYAYRQRRPPPRARVTGAIVALLIGVYLGQMTVPGLTESYALISSLVVRGQWWRLVTGQLLHANLLHLAANCYFGWNIGARVERVVGPLRMVEITLPSLLGAGASITLGGGNAVGFSGVLFGWLASWLGFHLTSRFPALRLTGAQRNAYLQLLAVNLVISLLPGISALGHLGGFVSGFLVSLLLGSRRPRAPRWSAAPQHL